VVAIATHCPHERMQLTDQAIIKSNKAQKNKLTRKGVSVYF